MGCELARVDRFMTTAPDARPSISLMDVPLRQRVELERIDLSEREAEPLMERGVLPGCRIRRVRNSPAGDPIVSIEGTLLALRREDAALLFVRVASAGPTRTA